MIFVFRKHTNVLTTCWQTLKAKMTQKSFAGGSAGVDQA